MKIASISLAVATTLTLGAAGGTTAASTANGSLPAWVGARGQTIVDKLPPTIKLSTDLNSDGFVWLDTKALATIGDNGPFDVFSQEAPDVVSGWYYLGAGIFPVGTSEDAAYQSATPATVATAESDK